MKSLVPNLVNWAGGNLPPAYYVHLGKVYISGGILNPRGGGIGWEGEPSVTQTIMTGMPVAIRPAVDTKVYLPIDPTATTDACNPALNLPTVWPSTVHPDGTWTLDEPIPASLNAPPPAGTWYYELGFKEPPEGIEAGIEVLPQYTEPFSVELGLGNAQWTVVSEPDIPILASLAAFLGVDWTNAASEYAVHSNRVHLKGAVVANKDEPEEVIEGPMPPGTTTGLPKATLADYTTAELAGALILLRVSTLDLKLLQDSPIVPAGDTPPLVYVPTLSPRTLLGDGEGAGVAKQRRTLYEWAPVGSCPQEIWDPIPPPGRCRLIVEKECEIPFHHAHHVTLDVATVFAMCLPAPDWFLIGLEASLGANAPAVPEGCEKDVVHGCGTGCSEAGVLTPDWETVTAPTVYGPEGEELPVTGAGGSRFLGGYLQPPASLYKGDPHIGAPGLGALLWHPGQLGVFSVGGQSTGAAHVELDATLTIQPFWEKRQVGAHSGDTLDLKRTGWEALVSTVNPGTPAVGHVPT